MTTIKYVYALGHLSEETDGSGNALASFTYEESGRPASVVLGNPSTGNRYYYVYNGHGDVVALTDASGTVVASYTYDAFGAITSSSENFPNGWSNPYRYDGADGVLYDGETELYWMSVRAYDPTLGRFLQHDPLGRLAAEGIDFHPYVYTDNNPINGVDPSGEKTIGCVPGQGTCGIDGVPGGPGSGTNGPVQTVNQDTCVAGVGPQPFNSCKYTSGPCDGLTYTGCKPVEIGHARSVAASASGFFKQIGFMLGLLAAGLKVFSKQLLIWGGSWLLSSNPFGVAFGLILLGLGAATTALAWQALSLAGEMGVIAAMYFGEQYMPDSWWTPANIHHIAVAAGAIASAVGVLIAIRSMEAKLPIKLSVGKLGLQAIDAFVVGKGMAAVVGSESGDPVARWLGYYTDMEDTCLTQPSCHTS